MRSCTHVKEKLYVCDIRNAMMKKKNQIMHTRHPKKISMAFSETERAHIRIDIHTHTNPTQATPDSGRKPPHGHICVEISKYQNIKISKYQNIKNVHTSFSIAARAALGIARSRRFASLASAACFASSIRRCVRVSFKQRYVA
jgi:hypothetical protein